MRHIGAHTAILAAASILAVLCALPNAPPTLAQSDAAPATCRVGLYLRDLHSFDPTADTFGADLWLWSVCPTADHQPLQTMEFVNSDDVAVLLDVGDDPLWTQRNVDGTFRYDWDERNFPFDRHTLTIDLEEGVEDVRRFVYEPDTANSGVDPELQLPGGWRMTGTTLVGSTKTYDTTFGDPDLPAGGSSEYSRLTLSIDLERTDLGGFFKLTAVVYAAFFFSLISYADAPGNDDRHWPARVAAGDSALFHGRQSGQREQRFGHGQRSDPGRQDPRHGPGLPSGRRDRDGSLTGAAGPGGGGGGHRCV